MAPSTLVKFTDVQTGQSWVVDKRPDPLMRDDAWTTADGTEMALGEMAQSHIENVIAFLRRRAEVFKRRAENRMWRDLEGPFAPGGDVACDAFDEELAQLIRAPSVEWIDGTPIVRALKAELVMCCEPWGVV
jgi:hypothetical protein